MKRLRFDKKRQTRNTTLVLAFLSAFRQFWTTDSSISSLDFGCSGNDVIDAAPLFIR